MVQRSRFAQIPHFWAPQLQTLEQARVAIGLLSYANEYGRAQVSLAAIAQTAGVDRRNVSRALRQLEDLGLVTRQSRGAGRSRVVTYWAKITSQETVFGKRNSVKIASPETAEIASPETHTHIAYSSYRRTTMKKDDEEGTTESPYHHGQWSPSMGKAGGSEPALSDDEFERSRQALERLRKRFANHAQGPVESVERTGTDA